MGAGSCWVGCRQYIAARRAARRFGITLGSDPTSTIMMRGAGSRDCVIGLALLYTSTCGRNYRPWLAARAAADAADGVGGVLSLLAGTPCAKQARTTVAAPLLSAAEVLLLRIQANGQAR